jgi:hypothetical protein
MIGKIFGWIFLLAAGAVLVRDGLAWHDLHVINLESFNTLWFDLARDSLGLFRGTVLNVMPWLWNFVIGPVLSLWAGPVLLLIALVLLWTGREGRRRHR